MENKPNTKKTTDIRKLALIGMFSALAFILMITIKFPLIFIAPSFYELDFSEVPVLIGTFMMGPIAGIIIEFIKIILKTLFTGTNTAYVGEVANFIIGCAFVTPASIIYKHHKTKRSAVIALTAGTLSMAIVGVIINACVLLPWYANNALGSMDVIIEAGKAVNPNINSVLTFVLIAVGPLNIIKGILVSIVTMILYKHISRTIKKYIMTES